MCTTCSTLMCVALTSGMVPDPASITREECAAKLQIVMREAAKVHQMIVLDRKEKQLQSAEVVDFLQKYDTAKVFKLSPRMECFGTLTDPCPFSSSTSSSPSLQDAVFFVGSLSDLFFRSGIINDDRKDHRVTAAALTLRGHTTCIFRLSATWYAFDSLTGHLLLLPGKEGGEITPAALHKILPVRAGDVYTAMVFFSY